jgi:septum formation protein
MGKKRKIILASKSTRRKKLLEQIGLKFSVRESEYEEDMGRHKNPYELVKHLALEKTKDVARHYRDAIIIGADTFIIYENRFIGKPKSKEEARKMLGKFSRKVHSAVSGFAIIDTKTGKTINDYGEAKVKFKKLTKEEIEDYIATGEPFDKAGGYGLQDRGAVLIESVSGDSYSVVGLPLHKIYEALKKMGVNVLKYEK